MLVYGADSACAPHVPQFTPKLAHFRGFRNQPALSLYQKWVDGVPIFVLVWVDDCTIVPTQKHVTTLVERIQKVFNIKDLGPLGLNRDGSSSILLGMEFRRTSDEFQIRQDLSLRQAPS